MKPTAFIFLVCCLCLSLTISSQTVTLSGTNLKLENVLASVKQQTGFIVLYDEDVVKKANPVSINANKQPLARFLDEIFKQQPLHYKIRKTTIVISLKDSPQKNGSLNNLSVFPISGVVKSNDGHLLVGATVRLKGKNETAVTDEQGRFVIEGNVGDVLMVSYVGFKSREYRMLNESDVAVVLEQVKVMMDTSVVTYSTGYMSVPKERATGSFVQIDNELFNRTISTNVLNRLYNVTSGLLRSNRAVGGTDMNIRGFSTISANKRPLIVVDGFPYFEGNESGVDGLSVIQNINPNDVENITILRDAAAASIWGARASNGVIVISTKKGGYNKKLVVQVNATANFVEKPQLRKLRIMGSPEVIDYEKGLFNSGFYNSYNGPFTPTYNFPRVSPAIEILLALKRNEITENEANEQLNDLANHDVRDDLDKYVLRTGVNQQYNINLSGGSEKASFYTSIGYDQNLANEVGNSFKRYSLRTSNSFRPLKNLELNSYISYTQINSENNGIGYTNYVANGQRQIAPYTMLADKDGNPLHASTSSQPIRTAYIDTISTPGLLDWHYKPLEEIQNNDNTSKTHVIRVGGGVKYTLIRGLRVEISSQYERNNYNGRNYYSLKTYLTRNTINRFMNIDASGKPVYPVPMGGILDQTTSNNISWNVRGQLGYDRIWNQHTINAIAGAEARESDYESYQSRRYGYDPLRQTYYTQMDYNTLFQTWPKRTGRIVEGNNIDGNLNRFSSYYSNFTYTLFDRYSISGSGRIDASNFFGMNANQRRKPLWSTGFLWDIAKETFYQSLSLPMLRFRVTYGYNGNMDNGATALPTVTYVSASTNLYGPPLFARLSTPPNPGLTWEQVRVVNLGLDFAFKENRINGSIEYYTKRGTDLIGRITVDKTVGTSEYVANYASIKGKGLDLILNAKILDKRFRHNLSFMLSYNTSEVTDYQLPQSTLLSASSYLGEALPIIGRPLYKIYSYKWGGLDKKNGNPLGYLSGRLADFSAVLQGNNAKPEDLVYHGSAVPSIFGSFINTFECKNFSVSFNIIYRFGYYQRIPSIDYTSLRNNWSGHSDYADRWKKPGDEMVTNVPSMPLTIDNRYVFYSNSEVLVIKADHIRFQDVKIGYSLGRKMVRNMKISNLQISFYANDLGVIWRANKLGIDPEEINIPLSKSFGFGISANF